MRREGEWHSYSESEAAAAAQFVAVRWMDGWIDGHSSQRTACFSAMPAAKATKRASPVSGDRAFEIESVSSWSLFSSVDKLWVNLHCAFIIHTRDKT